ncbi:gastrula zinc finger protein XlCGF8.2DB-like [Chrysoperla carnea]|uniref:gastrula zinc finger protein XlCGF8.2DB-like n=1 Tax=Chrysoperla carnea TaxID=189513 RepID=UPI001D08EE45|nr:gastrula zinc finger protein XlCGF8.2DB-like [Chrysoperla carnea]
MNIVDECVLAADFEKVCRICMKFDKNIKNEEDSSQGFGNDNYPVYIKEEDNSNQNEDEKTLEIKKEEENRRETRKKNIQYKFEEDSDNSEDIKEENDSDWESEDEKSDFEETQVKELAEFKCETCSGTFKRLDSLGQHMQRKHNAEEIHTRKMHPKPKKINRSREIINCEVCGKMCQRRYLRAHMNIHGERNRIACEYCAKIFISQDTLQTHVKTYHIGSGPICRYLCTECGLKLRSKHQLNNHLITHTKERPFACDKCDKTYRTTCMLKVHISRTHLNERNFVCTFCSQAFFDKKILLNHVRRHTGEKPYKCDLCDKSFIQRVALQGHMKIHSV